MDRFCGKCGSRLDEKTGLCPHCDMPQGSAAGMKPLVQAQQQNSKQKKAIIITLAVCVAVIAIAVAIVFLIKGQQKDDSNAEQMYTEYLQNKVVQQIGIYDGNDPYGNPQGLYSAKVVDLDGDGKREMFTVSSRKKGELGHCDLTCLHYEPDKVKPTKTTATTSRLGENEQTTTEKPTSETQTDPTQGAETKPTQEAETQTETTEDIPQTDPTGDTPPTNPTDGSQNNNGVTGDDSIVIDIIDPKVKKNFEKAAYLVEYNSQQYIFFEKVEYMQGYSYECHVFGLVKGKLQEVANIYVPLLGSTGIEMVYSTVLFGDRNIDDSDLDFGAFESGEIIQKDYHGKGESIWYFQEGGDSDFRYTTHFGSTKEAVSAFFKDFGIEKKEFVRGGDIEQGQLQLNFQSKSMIFKAYYYVEHDVENDTRKANIFFQDFTDVKSKFKQFKSEENAQDVQALAADAVAFSQQVYFGEHYDFNKQLDGCSYFKSDTIHSWEDLLKEGEKYYTREAMEKGFKMKHVDGEDGLYIQAGAMDAIWQSACLLYEKSSQSQYRCEMVEYAPYEVLPPEQNPSKGELNLVYRDGKWLFDDVLPFWADDLLVINKNDTEQIKQFEQFSSAFVIFRDAYDYEKSICEYYLFDIDKDGTDELIVHTGTYEKDRSYSFYRWNGSEYQSLGTIGAWHSVLYTGKDNLLYDYARTLGSYEIDQVSIENDKAQLKEVVPLTDITDEEETQKEIEQNYSKIKGKSMEDAQAMREIFFNQSNP